MTIAFNNLIQKSKKLNTKYLIKLKWKKYIFHNKNYCKKIKKYQKKILYKK